MIALALALSSSAPPLRSEGDASSRVTDAVASVDRPRPMPNAYFAEPGAYASAHFLVKGQQSPLADSIARSAEEALARQSDIWGIPIAARPGTIEIDFAEQTGRPSGRTRLYQDGRIRIEAGGPASFLTSSVIPHEVVHALFFSYFHPGHPPAWALEGAAISAEPLERRAEVRATLRRTPPQDILTTRQLIERPSDRDASASWEVYSQGESLVRYLALRGERRFLPFLSDGIASGEWDRALTSHYAISSCEELDVLWRDWARENDLIAGE